MMKHRQNGPRKAGLILTRQFRSGVWWSNFFLFLFFLFLFCIKTCWGGNCSPNPGLPRQPGLAYEGAATLATHCQKQKLEWQVQLVGAQLSLGMSQWLRVGRGLIATSASQDTEGAQLMENDYGYGEVSRAVPPSLPPYPASALLCQRHNQYKEWSLSLRHCSLLFVLAHDSWGKWYLLGVDSDGIFRDPAYTCKWVSSRGVLMLTLECTTDLEKHLEKQ